MVPIEEKLAASFYPQVAAWVRDMFCNFYFVKNHKIAKNSTIAKAREKISADLESLDFYQKIEVCSTKFENNQILLNRISDRFLLTTKKILIAKICKTKKPYLYICET